VLGQLNLAHRSHKQKNKQKNQQQTIRYDTIEEFNVDSKAEYSALSSTRRQKLKETAVPF